MKGKYRIRRNVWWYYIISKHLIFLFKLLQFSLYRVDENRALKGEIENYKNDLQESRHNLKVANEKLASCTNATEKAKASSEHLINEELQRLQDINSSQKEEISTVCVSNTLFMKYRSYSNNH